MKRYAMIVATLVLVGCDGGAKSMPVSQAPSGGAIKPPSASTPAAATDAAGMATADTKAAGTGPTSVLANGGVATLAPENTRIEFVGKHVGEKPDPRLGGFEKFTGKVSVDEGSKALTAVSFEIVVDSLWTQIGDKLTGHLKSPDFFDVKEYPEIKFQSTIVDNQDPAKTIIVGDLTLHGVTKSVSVPVTLKDADGGKLLVAEFTIDRAEFGMTYGEGKVENIVELTVVIGEKTTPKATEAAPAQ